MGIEEAVVRCSSCGAPVQARAPSCHFCGAQLAGAAPGAAATGPVVGPGSEVIEALRAVVARIDGAAEQQYGYAAPQQCMQFAQKLGGRLFAIANEALSRHGRHLRVNYVHAASPADAQTIYRSMVALVGKTNPVARKGDVIVEVISGDSRDVKAVLEVLRADEVHHTHHLLY